MPKQITKIPATISRTTRQVINSNAKRRVAAYARVSTDNEEQLTSYDAQVEYYTNYIKGRDDWEFVKVYADEGISGCNTKKRLGFQEMIKDALSGKIDLILTKSVSRFARNTVDSLSNIRNLKEHNVEVYFEKENIYTFDGKGELLLTIMASLSQEEARSISENVTWGHRKRFADGKVSLAYSNFLGYDKGEDGNLVVNKEEAKTIRLIYKLFLEGKSFYTIAKELTNKGIPTATKKGKWGAKTIESILKNEKYKGDALLQKSYISDFLTKRQKINHGEVPQYYVTDNHEAIVSKDVFEIVQKEIEKRTKSDKRYSGVGIFSSKIICGECNGFYGAKVWHSNDKYRKVIYRCNHKYENGKVCTTPHLDEDEIKELMVKGINKALKCKKEIIENVEYIFSKVINVDKLNEKKERLEKELILKEEKSKELIDRNANKIQDQKKYNQEFAELEKTHKELKDEYDSVINRILNLVAHKAELENFVENLKKQKTLINEFDETLFAALVENIVINKDSKILVLKDGRKVEI